MTTKIPPSKGIYVLVTECTRLRLTFRAKFGASTNTDSDPHSPVSLRWFVFDPTMLWTTRMVLAKRSRERLTSTTLSFLVVMWDVGLVSSDVTLRPDRSWLDRNIFVYAIMELFGADFWLCGLIYLVTTAESPMDGDRFCRIWEVSLCLSPGLFAGDDTKRLMWFWKDLWGNAEMCLKTENWYP